MERKPLISVAIPAYNHEQFVHACLESVVNQTYPHLELVIIDDDRGVSATSDECLQLSRGEWVHLLGSDDLLAPDKVAVQWQMVQDWRVPELGLIYADAGFIDATGLILDKPPGIRPTAGPTREGCRELFLANRIPNPTVALRREAFLAIGGFDEELFLEDWDCWLRLSARYPIGRVPKVLAYYRYHPGNTHRRQAEMLEAMLISFGKFLQAEKDLLPDDVVRRNWRKNLHRLWRWARKSAPGNLPLLAASLVKSLVSPPAAEDYFRYAHCIRRQLERRKPTCS